MSNTSSIISKVWSFCNILKDDGVGYGDYLEQLTYLLFLKMADEFSKPPYNRNINIPEEFNWEKVDFDGFFGCKAHANLQPIISYLK